MNQNNRAGSGPVLSEGVFIPYFQPVYHVARKCCSSAEILVRLQHPDKGLLLPADFLPAVARQRGMMAMTTALMEKVKAVIMAQGRRFREPFTLAFNIPASLLQRPDFIGLCRHMSVDLAPYNIVLMIELTEQERLEVTDELLQSLRALRAMPVSLALDDFGTGYSGLWLLQHLPVDKIKIPVDFISGIMTDHASACITDAVIQLAHWLEMTVTVEGVSSGAVMASVMSRGADYVQGYHYSRPLAAADFFAFCASQEQGTVAGVTGERN